MYLLQPHHNMRTCRKCAGLTQSDLAFLLNFESSSEVSRYEHNVRKPTILTLIFYELIFDRPPRIILQAAYSKSHDDLIAQAKKLKSNLLKKPSTPQLTSRIQFIDALIIKLTS